MSETSVLVRAIQEGRTDIIRAAIGACQSDSLDVSLKELLNSFVCEEGTLLHLACQRNEADIVRTLLAVGADSGIHNKNQQTALQLASDPHLHTVFQQRLLQAIAISDLGTVCQLLAIGVSVNLRDSEISGNTPLHWAVSYSDQELLSCLINRGADVNAVNQVQATPLHDAVTRGHLANVDCLLNNGARESIHQRALENSKYRGKTVLELAADKGGEIFKTVMAASEQTGANTSQSEASKNVVNGDKDSQVNDANGIVNHEANQNDSSVVEADSAPETPVTTNKPLLFEQLLSELATVSLSEDTENGLEAPFAYIWPRPQRVNVRTGEKFTPVDNHLRVFISASTSPENTKTTLDRWGHFDPAFNDLSVGLLLETLPNDLSLTTPHVICEINKQLFPREHSYRLSVTQKQIKLQSSCGASLADGIRTLLQLLRFSHPDGIPPVQITDWPSLACRGVLLDFSKGRIPHLDLLKNYICIFSMLKINQLQLYTRAKLPADENDKSWQFPYTRSILLELEHFCGSFGISLVPVLDVTPHVTLADLEDLRATFQNLLSCFVHSNIVSVGPRLTSLLTDLSEDGSLSLSDASRFLPTRSDQTLQLCAYQFHANGPAADSAAALRQLPPATMLAEYGFQSDYDFALHCKAYEENGAPFCLVAGSAAWNSLAGCPKAALDNIHAAMLSAHAHTATGVLLSHWSGTSHATPFSMIWPPLVAAAGMFWNADISKDYVWRHLKELTSRHVFNERDRLSHVIIELGRAETFLQRCGKALPEGSCAGLPTERGSTLHQFLTAPDSVDTEQLTIDAFQKTIRHIRKCQTELSRVELGDFVWAHVPIELSVCADLMMTSCRLGRQLVATGRKPSASTTGVQSINPGVANLTPTTKTDLANRLIAELEAYRGAWMSSNEPRGLENSVALLSHTLRLFVPGQHPVVSS